MTEIFIDSLIDSLKLIPFLYLSYLLVEYAEHRMSSRTKGMIYRAGKAGPVIGSLIGIIPQCGFSAAAAGLFAGGMISPGTLLAVFLSTSDEMLPVMIAQKIEIGTILKILAVKVVAAALLGLLLDLVLEHIFGRHRPMPEHPHMCEHEHCGCDEHGIWRSALVHTIQTIVFIFLVILAIGICMEWAGLAEMNLFTAIPGLQQALAALVGMIPNCAASVLITQLYLEGVLGSGALFAGLLCGAGTGLLVLYRENDSKKMNLAFTAVLYVSGLAAGIIAGALPIL
jgi:hypothetical protein